jgi:hypothetical protein
MKAYKLCLAFGLVAGLSAACGSKSDDDKQDAMGGAMAGSTAVGSGGMTTATGGTTAAAGSGGMAASSGSGGMTASSGSGGSGSGGLSVACGTATCMQPAAAPSVQATLPAPCCVDAAQGTCGSMIMGTCTPPPPPAPDCPMVAFSTSRPCCITATNVCGVDATAFGMGCIDTSASMGGVKFLCDGTEVKPGAGTGGAMAGGTGGAGAGTGGAGK